MVSRQVWKRFGRLRVLGVGIVATLTALVACSPADMKRRDLEQYGELLQSVTLEARFLYRGREITDRLPVECWQMNYPTFSELVTNPTFHATILPDGSAMIWNSVGLCDHFGQGTVGPTGTMAPREPPFRFEPIRAARTIAAPYATWVSQRDKPRVVDVYLTTTHRTEDVGGYVPVSFRIEPSPVSEGLEPEALALERAPVLKSWPPDLSDYCGAAAVSFRSAEFQSLVDLGAIRGWNIGSVVKSHFLIPVGTYSYREEIDRVRALARPVLSSDGEWALFRGEAHVLRLYRRDTVKVSALSKYLEDNPSFFDGSDKFKRREQSVRTYNYCR